MFPSTTLRKGAHTHTGLERLWRHTHGSRHTHMPPPLTNHFRELCEQLGVHQLVLLGILKHIWVWVCGVCGVAARQTAGVGLPGGKAAPGNKHVRQCSLQNRSCWPRKASSMMMVSRTPTTWSKYVSCRGAGGTRGRSQRWTTKKTAGGYESGTDRLGRRKGGVPLPAKVLLLTIQVVTHVH